MLLRNSIVVAVTAMLYGSPVLGQVKSSAEDSLQKGDVKKSSTFIGGYGDASYNRNFNLETASLNLNRVVLFVGHKFNDKFSFFSELEVEDAKIEGGEPGGEISLEQAYVKMNISKNAYITAGLFIPRIGLLNENHLPGDFNGVERPAVEVLVIPATWRELGVSLYGHLNNLPLNYSIAVCNGLNAEGFEHGTGIREGRFEGREATANNFAVTGSLQYAINAFRFQVSGYYGGSVGGSPRVADSLELESGAFGTPVALAEANIKFEKNGLGIKVLGTVVSIPDASDINRAYASNTPEMEYGFYGEVSYNLLESVAKWRERQWRIFARYEMLNLNSSIPSNGIEDGTLEQDHLIMGMSYSPIPNVVIKADIRLLNTGPVNEELVINPAPNEPPYKEQNTFLNIGIGYSF